MKHFIRFIFIATIFAIGMPTTECAIPKLSSQVRENARKFITVKLETLYSNYRTCEDFFGLVADAHCYVVFFPPSEFSLKNWKIRRLSGTNLQWDIEAFCALLDTFPSVLADTIARVLNPCNDASTGLREKITSFSHFEDRNGVCLDCLRDLFVTNPSKAEGKKVKELKVLNLVKNLWEICKFPDCICKVYAEKGLLQRTTNGYIVSDFFGDLTNELANDVYAECYEEYLRKCSKKVQTYHRMFLFFDKEIPKSDAALFYGEEVFRASLRYERVKRDIENGTVDDKTYRLVDRFEQLAREMLRRRNIMANIATVALKKDHFSRYHCNNRSNGKLPRELKDKIERETAFIDRMRARLTHMRNELNILQERLYRDSNWWKPANLIDEEEEKKILEEIE